MMGTSETNGAAATADQYALVLAQERFIVQAQTSIHKLLVSRGLKQADLAAMLGVTPARVSQMFADEARNLTLRTLAKIYHVLGTSCRVVEERAAQASEQLDPASPVGAHHARPDAPREPVSADGGPEVNVAPHHGGKADDLLTAWLKDVDVDELLAERAAFAKHSVWIGATGPVVPANENHPVARGSRDRGYDAARWADADAHYAYG